MGVNGLKKIRGFLLIFLVTGASSAFAAPETILKKRVSVEAVVVSSACSVSIDGGSGARSNQISFGQYNKSLRSGVLSRDFSIKLFERGATTPGCSAFLAGSGLVSLNFGYDSPGQLDAEGVVTTGVGSGVRILVSSTDSGEASSLAPITSSNKVIRYSTAFATRGVFGFNAQVKGLDRAKAGDYRGKLSVMVSYK